MNAATNDGRLVLNLILQSNKPVVFRKIEEESTLNDFSSLCRFYRRFRHVQLEQEYKISRHSTQHLKNQTQKYTAYVQSLRTVIIYIYLKNCGVANAKKLSGIQAHIPTNVAVVSPVPAMVTPAMVHHEAIPNLALVSFDLLIQTEFKVPQSGAENSKFII